ncbi:hypothetical protein MKW92_038837 [Papaver armeniacum]|nr:hypothetical protein MKW92_038837 [Papaver armeniacum]
MDDHTSPILENPSGAPATPFDYGSGHIRPETALHPGLVYDFNSTDMTNFLCRMANQPQIPQLLATCPNPPIPTYDLNYPSIGVADFYGNMSVSRTVTYVGHGPAVFTATWDLTQTPGAGVEVIVEPQELKFKEAGEKLSFKVHFVAEVTSYEGLIWFGSLTWRNGKYEVRSPIVLNLASAVKPVLDKLRNPVCLAYKRITTNIIT